MGKDKLTLRERASLALGILPESIGRVSYLELHGRSQLKLRDGGRILLYTKTKIKIALPHSRDILCVCGEELSCSYYNFGAVGVEGRINALAFINGGERKRI